MADLDENMADYGDDIYQWWYLDCLKFRQKWTNICFLNIIKFLQDFLKPNIKMDITRMSPGSNKKWKYKTV